MSDYQNVIDALNEHDLSWTDVDRILLNEDTYEEFEERASFDTSNYATTDSPAVRKTNGEEKILYVTPSGVQMEIEI